jgi:putative hemolysin
MTSGKNKSNLELVNTLKHIDIESSIKNGNSAFLKRLPMWVISLLKRIVKENEINAILNKFEGITGKDFLEEMLIEFDLEVQVEGMENLPEDGRCFFFANHPYGIIDGLVLTSIVARKYGDFRAIGNEVFMLIPQLRPVIASVSVFGKNSKAYLEALEALFNSPMPITHFPAGEVSRVYKRKVQDREWHKSFIKQSVVHGRPIVPFYFHGRNSLLFYSIFLFRRFIGLKLNIELILLPSEMLKKKGKKIRVSIGKPISSQVFDKSISTKEWAQRVKAHVYTLRGNIHHIFTPGASL